MSTVQRLIGQNVAATSAKLLLQLQAVDANIQGINYLYGHHTDIKQRLIDMGKVRPAERFPLVAVFEDFAQFVSRPGLEAVTDLKLIILHLTSKTYTREQRDEKVFDPILTPIYNELQRQMKISGFYMIYSRVEHTHIDRPHWGDPQLYRNAEYLLDNVLDGIEMANLELPVYKKYCSKA